MEITISDLSKVFNRKVQALTKVDLVIPTGMYGLLGPNGAGKTTLMRILAGIVHPTAGRVRVGPHDMGTAEGRQAVKRMLGYLPQDLGVYPNLNAIEFLDYIGILKGMEDRGQRHERIIELLETVGLTEVAGRKLSEYSGGMKQRVGIAQALLNDPGLLVVDEPTAGLDPEERIRFRNLLVTLAHDRTVILSTHIVEDIAQTSSRLAVLASGSVVFQGPTTELRDVARGAVWTLHTAGPAPAGDHAIVSAVQEGDGMHFRVVSATRPYPEAEPADPTLEDGYVALMRDLRVPVPSE